MKERPILFSAPMVRALLDGTKTQTRRIVKRQPPADAISVERWHHPDPRNHFWAYDGKQLLDYSVACPYGQQADRLWVRETFCPIYPQDPHYNGGEPIAYDYAATYQHGTRLGDTLGIRKVWKPSIHMPRAASRLNLEITGVRVERLQDISEADAAAEGWTKRPHVSNDPAVHFDAARDWYADLWDQINGAGSWKANPWVWVVEFKRMK